MHRSLLPSIASTSRRSASVDAFVWRSCYGCRGHVHRDGPMRVTESVIADWRLQPCDRMDAIGPSMVISEVHRLTGPGGSQAGSLRGSGEIDPVGSDRRPGRFPGPLPLGNLVGSARGKRPATGLSEMGSGRIPPTPPLRTLILGASYLQNPGPSGPNFSGFSTPPVQSPGGVGGLRPLP